VNARRRAVILILSGVALVLAVALPIVVHEPRTGQAADAWDTDVRFAVRVIDGERAYNVELTEYPAISGRVAYEGPALAGGEDNWKAAHDYRGVDLSAVVDRTIGLGAVETVTLVALDGWHKTLPGSVLEGGTPCGKLILALSVDGEPAAEWNDAPLLVFLPEDERFSNQDMLDAVGPDGAHYFGDQPSSTGLMVKGVAFLIVNYDGGPLPTLADL